MTSGGDAHRLRLGVGEGQGGGEEKLYQLLFEVVHVNHDNQNADIMLDDVTLDTGPCSHEGMDKFRNGP